MADAYPLVRDGGNTRRGLANATDAFVTFVGGNARGNYSNDFQRSRSNDNQVAEPAETVICGGADNRLANGAQYSTIGGGRDNLIANAMPGTWATPLYGVICGGWQNDIDGVFGATVGGGRGNLLQGTSTYSVINGGQNNIVDNGALRSVISGGFGNEIDSGNNCTITGGVDNTISGEAGASTICGGDTNLITGTANFLTICGGEDNTIGAASINVSHSVICGGFDNSIDSDNSTYCTIGGGYQNQITATGTAVANTYSVIMGGRGNVIDDSVSAAILWGRENTVGPDHNYAMCEGYYAQSVAYGTKNFSVHQFGSTDGSAQQIETMMSRQTTDATANLALSINYPSFTVNLTIGDDTCWLVDVYLVALRDDGSEGAAYTGSAAIRKDGAAAATGVSTLPVVLTPVAEDDASWTARIALSGDNVQVQVTGAASKTINWTANVRVTQVKV